MLEGSLTIQPLTTESYVRGLFDDPETEHCQSDLIEDLIEEVSGTFVRYLGLHAVDQTHVEVFRLRANNRMLSLPAKPIAQTPAVVVETSTSQAFTGPSVLALSGLTVNYEGGWIHFESDACTSSWGRLTGTSTYARVTYKGGLGENTQQIRQRFPDIAHAAGLQVKYQLERLQVLAGNISAIPGQGTQYTNEYGFLRNVRETLERHRRTT